MGIALASAFLFVGCGGGGGSSTPPAPVVDNSVLADGENQYGYFGVNVMFANTTIIGAWDFFNRDDNLAFALYSKFDGDGDGFMDNPNNPNRKYIDYGISQDGRVIRTGGDYSSTITLKNILNDYLEYVANGSVAMYDCYDVIFDDVYGSHNVIMCPSPF